jgi:hypothetical protein
VDADPQRGYLELLAKDASESIDRLGCVHRQSAALCESVQRIVNSAIQDHNSRLCAFFAIKATASYVLQIIDLDIDHSPTRETAYADSDPIFQSLKTHRATLEKIIEIADERLKEDRNFGDELRKLTDGINW